MHAFKISLPVLLLHGGCKVDVFLLRPQQALKKRKHSFTQKIKIGSHFSCFNITLIVHSLIQAFHLFVVNTLEQIFSGSSKAQALHMANMSLHSKCIPPLQSLMNQVQHARVGISCQTWAVHSEDVALYVFRETL